MSTRPTFLKASLVLVAITLLMGLTGCQPEGVVLDPQTGQLVTVTPPMSPLATPTFSDDNTEPTAPPLPTVTPLPTLPPEPTRSGTPIIKHGPTLTPSPTRPPLWLTPTPVGSPPADLQSLYYVADNNGARELRVIKMDDQGRKWSESSVVISRDIPDLVGLYPSPDGKYLAIRETHGYFVMQRSSGLTWCPFDKPERCLGSFAAWTLDNRMVYHPGGVQSDDVVPGGAVVVDITTGQYNQLDLPTQPQYGYSIAHHLSLSPDNSRLAYATTYWDGREEISEIWTMRIDSTDKRLLRRVEGVINTLSWSPVGEQLIYLFQPGSMNSSTEPAGLWLLNSDGTGERLLANDTRSAGEPRYGPTWSPDGRYVAFGQVDNPALFLSDWREPGTNVYIADTVTGQITKLSTFEGRNASYPTWSPDSKFVAFVSSVITGEPEYGAVPTYVEVWVASVDGSQLYAVSGTARWANALAWLSPVPFTQEK